MISNLSSQALDSHLTVLKPPPSNLFLHKMAIPNGTSHPNIDDELDFTDIEAKWAACLARMLQCL